MQREHLLFPSRVLSWFFVPGSTVPTLEPSTPPLNQEFQVRPFLALFFSFTYIPTLHSRALRLFVCRQLQG